MAILRDGVDYSGNGFSGKPTISYRTERAISDRYGTPFDGGYVTNEKMLDDLSTLDTASYRNNTYRGKDITYKFTSGSIYEAISNNFEDLFVGDFFDASYGEETKRFQIAGFNIYRDQLLSNKDTPHVVVVTDFDAGSTYYGDATSGYASSHVRTDEIPKINTKLTSTFGSHLLTIDETLSTKVDPDMGNLIRPVNTSGDMDILGCVTETDHFTSVADLMTDIEIYGYRMLASSQLECQTGCIQLPLFRLHPQSIVLLQTSYLLRTIFNVSQAGQVHAYCGYPTGVNTSMTRATRVRFALR